MKKIKNKYRARLPRWIDPHAFLSGEFLNSERDGKRMWEILEDSAVDGWNEQAREFNVRAQKAGIEIRMPFSLKKGGLEWIPIGRDFLDGIDKIREAESKE